MLFNSYVFILLFLPATWAIYFALNRAKLPDLAKTALFAASMVFYSYWNVNYLPLILGSVLFNFALNSTILKERDEFRKKTLFYAALVGNISLLCYYKYTNFFLENLTHLTGTNYEPLKIILPLGISYYTLLQIAYLVDVYQGVAGEKRLLDYALFVTFFPYLLSGPIGHYSDIMPQLESLRAKIFNYKNTATALALFVLGLSKKVLIADTLSPWVNEAYRHPETLHFFSAWGASISYTFQLYFDFSGYSDMAVAVALFFNVRLPQNFNSPFKAANINDFWSRWHMTLTAFIRTYIWTPIVRLMPKKTFAFSMLSMVIAMTIAGIWHGAAWTFVIYGLIHGLAIVLHYNWKKKKKKLPYWLGWLITFNFVNFTFIIFRSPTMGHAKHVLAGMLGLQGFQLPKMGLKFLTNLGAKMGPYMTNDENLQLGLLVFCFVIVLKARSSLEFQETFRPRRRLAVLGAFVFVACLLGLNRVSEFIYFNF